MSQLHDSKCKGQVLKEVSADPQGDEEVQSDSQKNGDVGSLMSWITWPTNRLGNQPGWAAAGEVNSNKPRLIQVNDLLIGRVVDRGQWPSEGFIESIREGAAYYVIKWRRIMGEWRKATQHI